MKRERYWGLYSLRDKTWRSVGAPHTSLVAFQPRPIKRDRYHSFQAAIEGAESWKKDPREIVPRPFYVTRKPRKLPAEAQAVIDATRAYSRQMRDEGFATGDDMYDAIDRYDESVGS